MGMPGQLSADSKSKKTDLRSKSKSKNRDMGRDGDSDSGRVSHNRERCREEWVRFSAWNVRSLSGRRGEADSGNEEIQVGGFGSK